MICLRCGYCCLKYLVAVVKDPEKGLIEGNALVLNGTIKCPHLDGIPGKSSCKIHHYEWFKETPCGQHTQFETENSNCRIGEYIIKNHLERTLI